MDTHIPGLLYRIFIQPILDIGIVLLPFILFGMVIRFIKGRIDDILINDLGKVPYYVFAFAGTPVHEISHLVTAIFFRHKIKSFSLFSPDKAGRLGYVEHAYDPKSMYQRIGCFFIGIAPIIGGLIIVFILTRIFLPDFRFETCKLASPDLYRIQGVQSFWVIVKTLARDVVKIGHTFADNPPIISLQTILYFYLILAIGSHMFPSMADLKGMVPGLLVFYILVCLFDVLLGIINVDMKILTERYIVAAGYAINFMIFIILLMGICFVLLFLIKTALSLIKNNG